METINKIRVSRLKILIKEFGGMETFCLTIDRRSPQVYQWLNEAPDSKTKKPRAISNQSARYIESRCNKPSGWMDQKVTLDANVEDAPNVMLSTPLNISGEIQGGDSGYLKFQQFPEGFSDGCVMHPVKNQRCYALRVRGDSMYPRIKHREVIVIDPDHPIEIGDEVVVSLKDERQMVKVLSNKREGEVTLKSVNNNHSDINVKIEDINEMHFVAAIIPIGSICRKV